MASESDKILYILRGCPGSGKSTLARELRGEEGQVFSTDEYFVRSDGEYVFDPKKVAVYHKRNHEKAREAISEGVSPVVIDNTNTTAWEMRPYVETGFRHGYRVQFVEPDTPWRYDPEQLTRRNSHGVPLESIKRMLKRFQKHPTVENVLGKKEINKLRKESQTSGTKQAPKKRKRNKSKIEDVEPEYSVPVPKQNSCQQTGTIYKIDHSNTSLFDEAKSKPEDIDILNIPFMDMFAMVEKSFFVSTEKASFNRKDLGLSLGKYASSIDT